MTDMQTPAVQMTGIDKSFYGVKVLDGVDFTVSRGEVHALAGGNGAGKSTLMKILQGVYSKDAGTVKVDGAPLQASSIHDAKAAGIGMVFQEFSLIPTLSVAQNIFLENEPKHLGLIDDKTMRIEAAKVLERMDVQIDVTADVRDLPTAQWQLTEIAKALGQDAQVLIMDEPTASLSKNEVNALFELIDRLREMGIAIVYISHRMDEVGRIADRITILRNGKNLWTKRIDEVSPREIVEGIAGRAVAEAGPIEASSDGAQTPLLVVNDLHAEGVNGMDFTLHEGEVLGLAGLMGSGRSELLRALFGVAPITQGTVALSNKTISLPSPAAAITAGIALIPEDRRLQGLILEHSVRENLVLPRIKDMLSRGFIVTRRIQELSNQLIEKMGIAVARPDAPARLLSGGNQQKIVIGKWLATEPRVLLMDEPTAGVDIGTKTEIADLVRGLAAQGHGVIVASSEYQELITMCDRYLIVRDGRIADSVSATEITTEVDLELAVQGVGA